MSQRTISIWASSVIKIYTKPIFWIFLAEKGLAYENIWEFECLVLMSKNHPLAASEVIDYETLMKASIEIVHGDNVIPYLPVPEIKKPLSSEESEYIPKHIYVYERGSQFDMLSRIPNTYMWVSPIPDEMIRRYKLVQRQCRIDNNSFKDLLIYPKEYKFSETDRKFINKLYEAKNDVSFREYK